MRGSEPLDRSEPKYRRVAKSGCLCSKICAIFPQSCANFWRLYANKSLFLYFLPKSIYSTELSIYSKIHSKQFCNFLLSKHFQKLCFFSLFLFELQVYYLKALICANRQTNVIKWDILLSERERKRERERHSYYETVLRIFSLIF